MRIALYGGSFNPPHRGHGAAAETAARSLAPDRFLIVPAGVPPHKALAPDSPSGEERMALCRLAFSEIPGAEISDIELRREGKSYTCDTVRALRGTYPEAELCLVIGTDMLLSFEEWQDFRYLLEECTLAVLARAEEDRAALRQKAEQLRSDCGARIVLMAHEPVEASSARIRALLPLRRGRELLGERVYAEIIRRRYYGAQPELDWLREKAKDYLDERRVAHVAGCESEAVRLARRWGEDRDLAAEAAILHDVTKRLSRDQQLQTCEKYGIINDNSEMNNHRLLHAKTGAALARDRFGVGEAVYEAIRWHTTGKPDMTQFEKILYLADYIEPTRDFDGVEELRALAYEDLDRAMALALGMTIAEVRRAGREVYVDTLNAYEWYNKKEK